MSQSSSRRIPAEKRKRTEISCDICKRRRQKCIRTPGQTKCQYCVAKGLECAATQPRKQRVYGSLENLGTRMRLLEGLAKGLVPEAELATNDDIRALGDSLGIPLPEDVGEFRAAGHVTSEASSADREILLPLVPDQQGQKQYIGPASSFSFHLDLRSLFNNNAAYEFTLFGPNAASGDDVDGNPGGLPPPTTLRSTIHAAVSPDLQATPSNVQGDLERFNKCIDSYFDNVHADFPVLHEASFRATFELWAREEFHDDKAWLMSLICVLLLGSRARNDLASTTQEAAWWQQVQRCVPAVLFTSNVQAVQALLLVALYLHHTNHRDAWCVVPITPNENGGISADTLPSWNMTGVAIRVAHAIGMHNDRVNPQQSPLQRELRKSLWWTLSAFESLQISSYDRPSAINESWVNDPDARLLGLGFYPPDYLNWSTQLTKLLAAACRARKVQYSGSHSHDSLGPLSPMSSTLRELSRWHDALPSHLRLTAVHATAPCHVRPILLLEAHSHYIAIVLTRSALLGHATALTQHPYPRSARSVTEMADACRAASKALGRVLLTLREQNCFNAVTWFDVFYTITSALGLALDVVCSMKQKNDHRESKEMLQDLAKMIKVQRSTTLLPGTLARWADLILELTTMVERYTSSDAAAERDTTGTTHTEVTEVPAIQDAHLLMSLYDNHGTGKATSGFSTATNDRHPISVPQHQEIVNTSESYRHDDPTLHNPFLPINEYEWPWDDIEAMLNAA